VLQAGEQGVELVEAARPEAALRLQPVLRRGERFRLQPAGAHAARLLGRDEAALLEQLEVLQEARQGHGEGPREVAHGSRPAAERFHHGPAGRVGEGAERVVEAGGCGVHGGRLGPDNT